MNTDKPALQGMRTKVDELPPIRGHCFSDQFSFETFLQSYRNVGFQGSCLYKAIEILRAARSKNIPIYLGMTSNIGTCGLRDTISYLVSNHYLAAVVTTAGAVEEDVMKTMGDFRLGDYRVDDIGLSKARICRTGNILIPSKIYDLLHLFLHGLNYSLWQRRWAHGHPVTDTEYIYEIGKLMDEYAVPRREESFVYLAYKNNTRIYCPALLDGAIGDALYNYTDFRRSLFGTEHSAVLDVSRSAAELIDRMRESKKRHGDICLLAVGGSIPKHMICNSAIFAGGAKYCVYINTSSEAEGSNAGAPVSEAVTYGKVKPNAEAVKVEAEASLILPILIAAVFKAWHPSE